MSNKKIAARRREARSHSPDAKVVRIRTEGKGNGVLKTIFIALLILLQIGLLLTLYLGFLGSFVWYQLAAFILSFLCCLRVLSSGKTGQTKTVWILFLLLFYMFGFIAYVLSDETVCFGWAKRRYKKIFNRTLLLDLEYHEVYGIPECVKTDAEYLWNTGRFTAYTNSQVKYYPSGAGFFDDVLESLKGAKEFIFIEFFIVADGVLLNRFYDVLSKKVAEGVDIRFICDGMGSHRTLSLKSRKRLKKAGIKLKFFNRIVPLFTFALNLRDHRKIVVVDGKVAYTGGCNLADEYVNEKRMHGYWKDAGLKIEGEAVRGLSLTFLRQWEFVTKKVEDYGPFLKTQPVEGDSAVIPYVDGKDYKHNICKGVFENIIAGANQKLYVMTPYFVPDEDTVNLLAHKALSGVDVRILLPEVPDKSYVYYVTVDNAERLLNCGVKVYKMRRAFVHSKVMLSENCATVGSANMDLRSYYNQFENMVYFNDKTALREVEQDFEKMFFVSEEITAENATSKKLISKLIAAALRIFSPLM